MKEIVRNFDEFKAKVDQSKPIHHEGSRRNVDRHGLIHELTFRIYGVAKDGEHLVVYEEKHLVDAFKIPEEFCKTHNAYEDMLIFARKCYEDFVQKRAKPLGSTEGKWID